MKAFLSVPEAHNPDTKMQGGTSKGRGKRKIAARIIGARPADGGNGTGVTSGSTRRAGFACAHTAQPLTNDTQSFVRQSPKFGFTLAEVLITLGIIGIVAAMTLPTLISKHEKKIVETKMAQFYSIMNQAIKMSEVENGSCADWDWPPYGQRINDTWFDKYLKPYLKIAKIYKQQKPNEGLYVGDTVYVLTNGVKFQIIGDSKVVIHLALDGKKSRSGINKFQFMIHPTRYKSPVMPDTWLGDSDLITLPGGWQNINNRDGLLETCKIWPARCAGLLMHENWQFPDDYPYKF